MNKTVTFESVYEEKEKDEDPGFKPAATMKYDELGNGNIIPSFPAVQWH